MWPLAGKKPALLRGPFRRASCPSTTRSQRNQDRRDAEPHSGSPAATNLSPRPRSHNRLGTRRRRTANESRGIANGAVHQSELEDAIQAERKKREYLSLFASNVALSYRKNAFTTRRTNPSRTNSPHPVALPPAALQFAELIKDDATARASSGSSPFRRTKSPRVTERTKRQNLPPYRQVRWPLRQGKPTCCLKEPSLETVLLNRLDGAFAGPVECLLANDVYSHDRQHILIPAGSKLLGETRRVRVSAKPGSPLFSPLAHARRIFRQPRSVSRVSTRSAIPVSGTRSTTTTCAFSALRSAIGAIGAVAEAGTAGALTASSGDLMRQGFAQSMGQTSAQILDKFLNVLPTVTIREGHRVKVYLSGDLALPDYANHTMPSNL